MLIRIALFLILLARVSFAPEFTHLPPEQTTYWAPPEGFGEVAAWSAPPEYKWPSAEAWAPPAGWVGPTEPWNAPEGWGTPRRWESPPTF